MTRWATFHWFLPNGPDPMQAQRGIGVAGTVTSLAALDLGLVEYDSERVHGHRLSDRAVRLSSTGSQRSRSRSGARCRDSSPSARP